MVFTLRRGVICCLFFLSASSFEKSLQIEARGVGGEWELKRSK